MIAGTLQQERTYRAYKGRKYYREPIKCGIYRILNAKTGIAYIGGSTNIQKRWILHRSRLRRGVHNSKNLQLAWDEFQESDFLLEILLECPKEILLEKEQHYLDLAPVKYNTAHIAGCNKGVVTSDETKKKIGEKSRRASEKRHRPVVILTLERELVRRCKSIKEAAEFLNVHPATVHEVLVRRRGRKRYKNYTFVDEKDYLQEIKAKQHD